MYVFHYLARNGMEKKQCQFDCIKSHEMNINYRYRPRQRNFNFK